MWLIVVIIAHFFNAVAFIIDKYLLTKSIPNPVAYSFYIGLLGLLGFILAPFGLVWPGFWQFLLALASGATFILALFFFFLALKENEASRVVPFIGGLQPIFIFVLSFLFLAERLSSQELLAFILLIIGGVIISQEKSKQSFFSWQSLIFAFLAALIFAFSFVLAKYIYLEQNFVSGFVWSRLGGGLMALVFLIFKSNRDKIFQPQKKASKGLKFLFLANQGFGALGFILLNYAIFLASVTLVNVLQGTQYAFLFLMVIFLSKKFPQILKEKLSSAIILKKIFAIFIISLGLVVLALENLF